VFVRHDRRRLRPGDAAARLRTGEALLPAMGGLLRRHNGASGFVVHLGILFIVFSA